MKGAFLSISKSGEDSSIAQEDETVENPKKRTKIGGAICNAAASCNSKANYKNDSPKTFFYREHYELLSKPARKSVVKIK